MAKARKRLTRQEKQTPAGRFALHLRGLLDGKGWQVGDLHERLRIAQVDVDKPAIHKWLRGDGLPKTKDLEALGRVLGLRDYRHILPPPA